MNMPSPRNRLPAMINHASLKRAKDAAKEYLRQKLCQSIDSCQQQADQSERCFGRKIGKNHFLTVQRKRRLQQSESKLPDKRNAQNEHQHVIAADNLAYAATAFARSAIGAPLLR